MKEHNSVPQSNIGQDGVAGLKKHTIPAVLSCSGRSFRNRRYDSDIGTGAYNSDADNIRSYMGISDLSDSI